MMIYIAIPTITPRLERCALEAIERTTPEPHRVIIVRGRSHGAALNTALRQVPDDAKYFVTMDDDAAPLRACWLSWMVENLGDRDYLRFGESMAVGCLYRVPYVKWSRPQGASFDLTRNPGDAYRRWESGLSVPRATDLPWWLTTAEAYRDDDQRLIFAHLGGGTIGHTWHHGGKLYPRIPTWLWPIMVRRHLRQQFLSVRGDRKYQRSCVRCGRVIYHYGMPPVICTGCETPQEAQAHARQIQRARQLQAEEERG